MPPTSDLTSNSTSSNTYPPALSDNIKQAIIWAVVITVIAIGAILRCVRNDAMKMGEKRKERLRQERLQEEYQRRTPRLNEAPPPYASDYAMSMREEHRRGIVGGDDGEQPNFPDTARVR
ncbi:hypothetical protein P280DRAFT_480964 [Massarina eburnea CBS 473.64]|uniref:Uncharacterized protein n=1 Tax=Massarina eburnea CBS 473.64 TaxID=1395130 RepID=A0A6A6RWY1_9PLEO|nr:hypothetical protein P280DRAFT_480964 [Massarina eburnea CBS 473.64]